MVLYLYFILSQCMEIITIIVEIISLYFSQINSLCKSKEKFESQSGYTMLNILFFMSQTLYII